MLRTVLDKITKSSDRQIALLLFSLAFILRGIYALLFYFTNPLPETNIYYELGLEILKQGRVFYDTSHPYYEFPGPVIPWMSAITMLIFGKNYLSLYLVSALGSALVTYFTYKTSRLFLDKNISLFAGGWSVIYIFYFYFTPSAGKDIWMAFFMIYLIYNLLILFGEGRFNYYKYVLFIVMFVISFHLDERYFIFTPFLGLFILFSETSGFRRLAFTKTAVFGILLLVLMVPWTIRNYNKHNKIVLLSTRTEAFTDPVFGYPPREHMLDEFNDIHGMYYISDTQFDSVVTVKKTYTDMGRKISPGMVQAMQQGKMPKPLTGLRAFSVRLLSMFEPFQITGRYERSGYFYYKKSLRHNISSFLFYGLMLIFSLPGFLFLYKTNRRKFYLFLSIITIYALIHALTIPYTNWRYRLPLDSIFIMVGSSGLFGTYNLFKKKNKVHESNNPLWRFGNPLA